LSLLPASTNIFEPFALANSLLAKDFDTAPKTSGHCLEIVQALSHLVLSQSNQSAIISDANLVERTTAFFESMEKLGRLLWRL
jgi:hypothetical protein